MRLTFLPLEGGTYLCATEVSVGLFKEVIDSAGLLRDKEFRLQKRVDQPRTWQRDGEEISVPKYFVDPMSYAPGVEPEVPTADHPVQRISPAVAEVVARALGCRLPTGAEWDRAVALEWAAAEVPSGPAWNLRDKTWRVQQEYFFALRKNRQQPVEVFGDTDVFDPRQENGVTGGKAEQAAVWQSRELLPDRSAAAGEYDDKHLWFRPVNPGADAPAKRLHHLIGNVAEYLIEPESDGKEPQVLVAGGSCLSSPTIDPRKPYPVERTRMPMGRSDVGFRLAFSASTDQGWSPALLAAIKDAALLKQ
jgi:hypothetical protein